MDLNAAEENTLLHYVLAKLRLSVL